MPEQAYEVRPYGVDYVCDDCGRGAMEAVRLVLDSDSPLWEHKCGTCGRTALLPAQYPTIRWERVSAYFS